MFRDEELQMVKSMLGISAIPKALDAKLSRIKKLLDRVSGSMVLQPDTAALLIIMSNADADVDNAAKECGLSKDKPEKKD